MEVNSKQQINPNTAEGLKKQEVKRENKEDKGSAAINTSSPEPSTQDRVKLSKESIKAASDLEGKHNVKDTKITADQEKDAQDIALEAGRQLLASSYGLTTSSAQKLFETLI